MRNNLGKVTLMISILLCFGGLTACESAKEKNISYVGDAANSLHIPDSYMEEWKVNKNTVKLAVGDTSDEKVEQIYKNMDAILKTYFYVSDEQVQAIRTADSTQIQLIIEESVKNKYE